MHLLTYVVSLVAGGQQIVSGAGGITCSVSDGSTTVNFLITLDKIPGCVGKNCTTAEIEDETAKLFAAANTELEQATNGQCGLMSAASRTVAAVGSLVLGVTVTASLFL